MNDPKILAIDDSPYNLTVLKAIVASALPGCVLLTALDGHEGIELARTEDPDVILLDIVMPGMDGFEVCLRVKADEQLRDVPVVFLTALGTDRESRVKALEAGAEAFLSKPPDEQELLAQIRAMAKLKAANRVQRVEGERLTALVAERTRELERQIAERERAEEALRESEAFTRAVLDNLPVGIAVNSVDPTVSFNYMNDNFPRFYRTTREKLTGVDTFWDVVYEDPELRDAIRRRVLDDCASGDAERMRWVDVPISRRGEETSFISAQDIPVPGRRLMISTVWDVSDRKRAEARMAEQLEELRRWHQATLGREGRILELKKEVNELLAKAGQPPRYPSGLEDA